MPGASVRRVREKFGIAGAVGLNLTQANHVIIMDPSINPALDAQGNLLYNTIITIIITIFTIFIL